MTLALGALWGCGLLIYVEREQHDSVWDSGRSPTMVDSSDSLDSSEPLDTGPPPPFSQVSNPRRPWVEAGENASCLLDATGAVTCWGDDSSGLVSDTPDGSWDFLTLGDHHGCVLASDGSAACWGANDLGQATASAGVFRESPG